MPLQRGVDLAHLDIPQLGGAVHRASGQQDSIGVEGNSHDFSLVASESSEEVAGHSVPNLGSLVEGAGANPVAKGDIEAHTIYCIFMAFKGMDQIAGSGVP